MTKRQRMKGGERVPPDRRRRGFSLRPRCGRGRRDALPYFQGLCWNRRRNAATKAWSAFDESNSEGEKPRFQAR